MEMKRMEEIVYPSIVFTIKGQLYCINSKDVTTILQLPPHEPLPDAPACVTGMFSYRDDVYQMLDLRTVFGMPTLEQENDAFAQMIDQRRQDHIVWVEELDRSLKAGESFKLATDPHKCAFGQWYDNFEIENHSVNMILRKIEEPHRLLHEAAVEAANCTQQCDTCGRAICLKEVMNRVEKQYMPVILELLDEIKTIFKSNVYREMALIMNDSRLGIVVDEVLSVEELETLSDGQDTFGRQSNSCLGGMYRSPRFSEIILEVDARRLLHAAAQQ